MQRLPKQHVRYRVDHTGAFVGVDNIDELRAAGLQAADLLAELDPDDPTIDSVRELFAELPDESIVAIFAEEPQVFHYFDGLFIDVDDPLEGPDVLPNAFGGEPFPATTRTMEILTSSTDR